MISCQTFRANLQPGTHDAELLAHVRRCDACLELAVQVDPDMFFRSIGGENLLPPGGVDAFVSDVMAQVRSRETETAVEPRHRTFTSVRRLAIAATVAAAVMAGLLVATHQPAPQPRAVPLGVDVALAAHELERPGVGVDHRLLGRAGAQREYAGNGQ